MQLLLNFPGEPVPLIAGSEFGSVLLSKKAHTKKKNKRAAGEDSGASARAEQTQTIPQVKDKQEEMGSKAGR